MSLISEHHLAINQTLIVVMVMESGSTRSATTDGEIGLDSTTEVFLLAIVLEE